MATQAVRPQKALSARRVSDTPAELIRKLISQALALHVEGCTELPDGGSPTEEIILDMDVGGSRYLLVRLPKEERLHVQLSPREQEIVRMVARGHSTKIIAGVLNISSWTVCTHLRRIFAKFGVSSRAAMVARMLDNEGNMSKLSQRLP